MRKAERSTHYRRRPWRLRPGGSVSILAALFATLAFFGSAAARAADESEAEARINDALSHLPPDQAEAAFREILAPDSADLVTESYTVSPGSLRSLDSAETPDIFIYLSGVVLTSGFYGCVYAPLHLPRGATVTGLVMWFEDTGLGPPLAADIRRKSITSTAGAEVMGSVVSTNGAGIRLVLDATISNGVIDNDNYVYSASVCHGWTTSDLHGLNIIYNR